MRSLLLAGALALTLIGSASAEPLKIALIEALSGPAAQTGLVFADGRGQSARLHARRHQPAADHGGSRALRGGAWPDHRADHLRRRVAAAAVGGYDRCSQPDVVVLFTYPRLSALIIKRAYELGLKSTIVLAATGTADLKALSDNVGSKDAFKDLYYQDTINDVPTGPKQKWIHDLYAEKYPDLAKQPGHPTDYFSNDTGGFLEVTYGLMMAGPIPTREGFVKATQNMWFETGSQAGPYILTPNDRTGGKATTFLKFDGQTRTMVPGVWYSDWKFGETK